MKERYDVVLQELADSDLENVKSRQGYLKAIADVSNFAFDEATQ
jgi:hypothetical protein